MIPKLAGSPCRQPVAKPRVARRSLPTTITQITEMHAPLPRFNAFMGKLSTRGYGQLRDFPGILAPSLFQKRDLLVSSLCETFFEVLATICLLFKFNMQGRRCLEMVIQRDKSLSFDKFDNLRGFQIKHQKLISETKSVRKILSETNKTEEYKHLDEKSSERVKNSILVKITP